MTPFRAGSFIVFATALATCSPADGHTGTTFVDSAGVTLAIAESPLWEPGEGWRVWKNSFGVISEQAAKIATAGGLDVVMDRCMKIEHARYIGRMHWLGFNTGQITAVRKTPS